jgi:hypothetical protein
MDVCVLILRRFDYRPAKFLEQNYGEEFIELLGSGGEISVKLLEPRNIAHIASVNVCTYLSEVVPEALVLYFLRPIKGMPMCLPIQDTNHVEKDVVRGFFFCLSTLGFRLNQRTIAEARTKLDTIRQELTDGDEIARHISSHIF